MARFHRKPFRGKNVGNVCGRPERYDDGVVNNSRCHGASAIAAHKRSEGTKWHDESLGDRLKSTDDIANSLMRDLTRTLKAIQARETHLRNRDENTDHDIQAHSSAIKNVREGSQVRGNDLRSGDHADVSDAVNSFHRLGSEGKSPRSTKLLVLANSSFVVALAEILANTPCRNYYRYG